MVAWLQSLVPCNGMVSVQWSLPIKTTQGTTDSGGLCGQVVHIQRCINITEVVHKQTYSSHYEQVVLFYSSRFTV